MPSSGTSFVPKELKAVHGIRYKFHPAGKPKAMAPTIMDTIRIRPTKKDCIKPNFKFLWTGKASVFLLFLKGL